MSVSSGTGNLEDRTARSSSAVDVLVTPAQVPARTAHSISILARVFSFPAMLGTSLVGAVFYYVRGFSVDPDLWWHIKVGQNILATHRWPTTDPFSFTVAGQPWLAYEWLGDVLLGATERAAGLLGLVALLIVLGSAVILALYSFTTLRSGNSKSGFLATALLCLLAVPSFNLRPQMLGYLFVILVLIVLERFRRGRPRGLWFLPPIFLVWINTHGSWIIGLGIIFVVWAGGLMDFHLGSIEAKRWSPAERTRLELIFLLCLAAIPFTPYGSRLAAYPFMVASSLPVNVSNILEWQPMPFNIVIGKLFLAAVIAFFVAQLAYRFTWQLGELVLVLGGIIMACLHVRFLMLFVPFFAPLFATVVARWLPRYDRAKEHYVLNAGLMALVVAAVVWYFPTRADLREAVTRRFPVRAVEYLQQHPVSGPMYNSYGYGGYLVWSRWPEHKVFIDGRGDLYEIGGALTDYLEIGNLKPAAFTLLRAYGIQSCLIDRQASLATALDALPEWRTLYSDDVSVLFVRRDSAVSPDVTSAQNASEQKE
jgi:hypothetical protein